MPLTVIRASSTPQRRNAWAVYGVGRNQWSTSGQYHSRCVSMSVTVTNCGVSIRPRRRIQPIIGGTR